MKRQLIAGCIALAAGIGGGQASAATYAVTADATVYQFLPNGNLAFYPGVVNSNTNYVMGHASNHGLVSLLDFDTLDSVLSSLTPGNYTATLHMTTTTAVTMFGSVNPSAAYPLSVNVGTNSVAWTEAGAISYAAVIAGGSTTYSVFTADSGSGTVSADITSLVAYWATQGSTGAGLMLSSPLFLDGANAYVAAAWFDRESGNGAYIDIQENIAPTPVPAALPLFATGLGALGLIAHRRKRKQAA